MSMTCCWFCRLPKQELGNYHHTDNKKYNKNNENKTYKHVHGCYCSYVVAGVSWCPR
jgi:hypothetical protein